MAKRVVVELQMKTIKRFSFPGFLTCLFLAVFVALPIVELFLPFNVVDNYSFVPTQHGAFTVLDVIKSVFKMDDGALMALFTNQVPSYTGNAAKMYQIFIDSMPYIFIAIMAVFFLQCALAIWALILLLKFLFTGRWSHFKSPFTFSHFGLWSTFFVVLLGNGIIIFSTAMGAGGYNQMSNAYLVFPGWLYTVIYFGAGLVSFIGIFFAFEYGFADRIYIGKNRRPNEPEVVFFDKNNYVNITEVLTAEQEKVEEEKPQPDPVTEDTKAPENIEPKAPVQEVNVKAEPDNGIPTNIIAIGGHAFATNQNLVYAEIPEHIDKLGDAAFSNCLGLKTVLIPKSVKSIGSNCFFNCARLTRINYKGTKQEWKTIKRGSNWLLKAGTKVVYCSDGPVQVNPLH